MKTAFEAAFWGLVGASALIVGAEVAFAFNLSSKTIGLIMAFGVGALISSVSFELVLPSLETATIVQVSLGLLAGALTFFIGDRLIGRLGSGRKKPDGPDEGSSGLGIVLGTVLDGHPQVETDRDPTEIATYPLAMPMMATPIGIVILTTVSARYNDDTETLVIVAILLAIVMAINLVVLLTESTILKYISPDIINVAERILGLLLAALAVQTMLNALQELGLIVIKTGAH